MNEVITIVLTIIVFVGVIAVIYILAYNNLQANTIKINEAESIIDELLRKKYDLLLHMQKIITDKVKVDKKIFNDLKNLKAKNVSSFEFERKTNEFNNLINQIKADHSILGENKELNKDFYAVNAINEKLDASKTFYNKYTSHLNKAIKKFPSNIIAKIHHMKLRAYFDGKDMFDDNKNDFKS